MVLIKYVQDLYSSCLGSQENKKKQSEDSFGGHPVIEFRQTWVGKAKLNFLKFDNQFPN